MAADKPSAKKETQKPNGENVDFSSTVFKDKTYRINSKSDNKKLLKTDFFDDEKAATEKKKELQDKDKTGKPTNTGSQSKATQSTTKSVDETEFSDMERLVEDSDFDEDDFEDDDEEEESVTKQPSSDSSAEDDSQETDEEWTSDGSDEALHQSSIQLSNPDSIFNYEFEDTFFEWYNKKYSQQAKILNDLLLKNKPIFPFFNGHLSLFDFFILISGLSTIKEEKEISPKYGIHFFIDKYHSPAFVSKLWDVEMKKFGVVQDDINNECFFPTSKIAMENNEVMKQILESGKNTIFKKNSVSNPISGTHFDLVSSSNLFCFPDFDLNLGTKTIENMMLLQNLIDHKIVKFVSADSMSKEKWIELFKAIVSKFKKQSKNKFDCLKAEEIYDIFSQSNQKAERLLIPTDFELTPTSKKLKKIYKKVYSLVYYSWFRYCISNQECSELIEIYFLNMYEFKTDTIICPALSGYNYMPELFELGTDIYPEIPAKIMMARQFVIDPISIAVKPIDSYCVHLDDLLASLTSTALNLTDVKFIFKSVLSLIDNDLLKINAENKFSFAAFLQTYFKEVKKENYVKLQKSFKSLLDTYLSFSRELNFYQAQPPQEITDSEEYKANISKIESFNALLEELVKLQ